METFWYRLTQSTWTVATKMEREFSAVWNSTEQIRQITNMIVQASA